MLLARWLSAIVILTTSVLAGCMKTNIESRRNVRPGSSWGALGNQPGNQPDSQGATPNVSPNQQISSPNGNSGPNTSINTNRNTLDSGGCYKADEQICEIERLILEQTNAYRAKSGLAPLAAGYRLGFAARDWSQTQAERGRIGHAGFPSARRSLLVSEFGQDIKVSVSAENVAMTGYSRNSNEAVASDFTRMWWNSSGHRRNMLGNYRSLGVGVAKVGRSWYATQIFGRE